jgi:hypothetical protein
VGKDIFPGTGMFCQCFNHELLRNADAKSAGDQLVEHETLGVIEAIPCPKDAAFFSGHIHGFE